MQNAIVSSNTQITMTSLEMVDFINSQRGEGGAVLAHSDFLKKVPQVLGEEVAGNFSGYYKASNGKQNPMYTFQKREACLMAMSYSYDLQAKVFDRMTALETEAKPRVVSNPRSAALIELLIQQDLLEQEQQRMANEQRQLTEQTGNVSRRLDQIETAQNHFTVVGYANLSGVQSLALANSSKLGKAASRYCKDRGIEMGEVPDPRYGRVKTYPKFVLDIVFEEILTHSQPLALT